MAPIDYKLLGTIADPNTAKDDPVTYHMYAVTAWRGGEPTIIDDEHTELRWFKLAAAISLADLAVAEYRPLLQGIVEIGLSTTRKAYRTK